MFLKSIKTLFECIYLVVLSWFIWPDLDLPIRCCQETNAGGESAAYDGQLFAGLSINYIKVNPIQRFAVYESMKSWLRIPPRERSKPA
ncbi:unnamed protein product [Brassica oleracea var. botrytis]